LPVEAAAVEAAVEAALRRGLRTADLGAKGRAATTTEMTAAIVAELGAPTRP
jgi:3-isopropylmalate dehydrogenase